MQNMTKEKFVKKRIAAKDITPINQRGVIWVATVGPEVTLDDVLDQDFWSHVAGRTFNGVYNEVTVVWEDNSRVVKLFVRAYDSTTAFVELLDDWEFDKTIEMPKQELFHVLWAGPELKYRIIRKEDGAIIREGVSSKEDAARYITEHMAMVK